MQSGEAKMRAGQASRPRRCRDRGKDGVRPSLSVDLVSQSLPIFIYVMLQMLALPEAQYGKQSTCGQRGLKSARVV